MVCFDEKLTLDQKMKDYDMQSLKIFAYDLGMARLSKLRKAELVKLITDKLLDPETMFYRTAIFSDREVTVFEKGFHGPVKISDEDTDIVAMLNEMDLAVVSRGEFLIPCDVVEVWRKIRNDEFEAYRKRASWVWKCLYWAEEMYVVTPIETMLELIQVKKGVRMNRDELWEMFRHFPEDRLWTIMFDDFFFSSIYADKTDALEELRRVQADKPYYIPTVAEVEELFETGALLSGKAYQDMLGFLAGEMGMERDDALDILFDLWNKNAIEDDPRGTMQWFWNQFEFDDDAQVERMVSLYMPLVNETRLLVNRGYKPSELHAMSSFGFNRKPVIVTSEKKIYPNDLCPCGSGKKYKKCCGR